jgi:hypothetical protein
LHHNAYGTDENDSLTYGGGMMYFRENNKTIFIPPEMGGICKGMKC